MGFEKNEAGELGMYGRDFSRAEKWGVGSFSGLRAEPWFRGFAHDGANLGDQSRIYSGSHIHILLRGKGMVIGVIFNEWSPDIKVDRNAAAQEILQSLQPDSGSSTTPLQPDR